MFGSTETKGYVNITMPKELLSEKYRWTVLVEGINRSISRIDNSTHTSLFVSYDHNSYSPIVQEIIFTGIEQYFLNVVSAYGNCTGKGWYDKGKTATIAIKKTTIDIRFGTRVIFTGWTCDFSGSEPNSTSETSATIVMNSSKIVVANWKTQYYLKVITQYGNVSGEGWYDKDSIANISITPQTIGFLIRQVSLAGQAIQLKRHK